MPAQTERTNEAWLADLADPLRQPRALTDLEGWIRGVLARALNKRGPANDADLEDFTQEALMSVVATRDQFRGDSRFTTWVSAIALRTAFGALRRRAYLERSAGIALDEVLELPDDAPSPSEVPEPDPLLDALRAAIEEDLTPRQRTAVLAELDGIPNTLLAERMQTTAGALYKLHHDARRKLKRALNAAGFRDEDVLRSLENDEVHA